MDRVECTVSPGAKIVQILKSNGDASFSPIYVSTNGIASYLFSSADDKIVALDYNGDGYDDLMCYHPGKGIVHILKSNGNATFSNVYNTQSIGLAGYKFSSTRDYAISFDYNGDNKDDLFCFNPGSKVVQILKSNGNASFTPVYKSTNGIGGFLFSSSADKVTSLDYNGDGYDDLLCYHPDGSQWTALLKSKGDGEFLNVYFNSGGIAAYSISDPDDRLIGLNYNADKYGDILIYRAGSNKAQTSYSDGTIEFKHDFSQN